MTDVRGYSTFHDPEKRSSPKRRLSLEAEPRVLRIAAEGRDPELRACVRKRPSASHTLPHPDVDRGPEGRARSGIFGENCY
jgi:hypothetical protein